MRHELTEINEDEGTATCAVCGPESAIYSKRGRYTSWACKKARSDAARAYRAARSTEELAAERMLRTYKITPEQRDAKLASQGGVCAICKGDGGGRAWCIDHDHSCCSGRRSCGKCLRGVLCHKCNTALGLLDDDTFRIQAALQYIEGFVPRPLDR